MFLDGVDIGLGKVVITDSQATINNIDIPTKRIDIYNRDNTYKFTFWTIQDYKKYNELELNKKTDILNTIDDYDINFSTEEYGTVNSRENTEIYFTKIDPDKYIIDVEIKDFDKCLLGDMKNHKYLKLETIIDFNKENF